MSTFAKNIRDAVVIKDWNLFLLTEPSGQIPIADGHGLGFYYHDCRYLNGYELKLGDKDPNYLGSQSEDGYKAIFQLANPDLEHDDGRTLARETLGIRWERALQSRSHSLVENLLSILLGFEPRGAQKRLVVRRPLLPDRLEFLELKGLNFAGAKIDLRFDRDEDGIRLTNVSERSDVEVARE